MAQQEQPKRDPKKDAGLAADERPRPSQAEGEENPGETNGSRPTPSQAEGEDRKGG
jgi:hypothetical protein